MRVTFLAHKLDRTGGSSFSLNLMAHTLSERGHSVQVLTTNMFQENNPPDDLPYRIVPDVLSSKNKITAPINIRKTLRSHAEETDIYHIFNPQYLGAAGLYAQESEVSVVGRLNAYDGFCTNPSYMDGDCHRNCTLSKKIQHDDQSTTEKLARIPQYIYQHYSDRLVNYLDGMFALSPSIKNVYEANGVDEDLIEIIPNFYDPSFGVSDGNSSAKDDEFRIVFAGRLRQEKGPDILLRALEYFDTENVQVDVLGDGVMMAELTNYVEKQGLEETVSFHGWVANNQLPTYLRDGDVFVHPGRWPEPFGRVILEAMQCRCPPVVSDVGAPPWIVGSAGEVFESENEEDLSSVLGHLSDNPDCVSDLAMNCSERLKKFKPEVIIPQIESSYMQKIQK